MLTEPIVEGAYYECEDGQVVGPARPLSDGRREHWVGDNAYTNLTGKQVAGPRQRPGINLTRRVYLVPTDPAEVVAELLDSEQSGVGVSDFFDGVASGYRAAADLVAEKLLGGKQ